MKRIQWEGGIVSDKLRDDCQFEYRQAKANRFAEALTKGGRLVALDSEVAAAFQQSESVNAVLRGLLHSMPERAEAAIQALSS